MAKYTEAFCTTTGGMVSIMQMRSEYNHDPAVYEKVYKGHLFCPGCQAVPLTVVHANGTLFTVGTHTKSTLTAVGMRWTREL